MRRCGLLVLLNLSACDGRDARISRPDGPLWPQARATDGGGPERLLVDPDGTGGELLGASVALPGDVDGDGSADLLAGAWGAHAQAGAVHLFFGGATGPVSDQQQRFWPDGLLPGDRFGSALAAAGDVDGDGAADFLVGAAGDGVAGPRAGAVWRVFGGPGPWAAEPLRPVGLSAGDGLGRAMAAGADLDGDGLYELVFGVFGDDSAGADAGALWLLPAGDLAEATRLLPPGLAAGDWLGAAVAMAGDVNGDGYGDLIAGAPGSDGGGAAYLWLGGPDGPLGRDGLRLLPPDLQPGDDLGAAVAAAGDLDGDGFVDLALGAPGLDAGRGGAWPVFGGADGISLGEPVGGPLGSVAAGASLAAAGDLDGDGLHDLLVGAPGTASGAGLGLLWLGSADRDGAPELLPLASSDLHAGDGQGLAVAGASDLDGDGRVDLVLGRYGDDSRAGQAGAVALYRGCAGEDADRDGVCADVDCDDGDPVQGQGALRYRDADGDGFGDPSSSARLCGGEEPGWVPDSGDCDDGDPAAWPGAAELWGDGIDGDCDGREWCGVDRDGDGHSSGERIESADGDCDDPYEALRDQPEDDCDDLNSAVWPGAPDVCGDGLDADCDGQGGADDDEDGDGLPTQQEWARGTDPCDPDSDGDGLNDLRDPQPLSPPRVDGDTTDAKGRCSQLPATGLGPLLGLSLVAVALRRKRGA